MAKTPKSKMSIGTPATVGKISKNNVNDLTKFELFSDGSKSIASSICTPRRMTRSFAKMNYQDMPPPSSNPAALKKKKTNVSSKMASATKPDGPEEESVKKNRKSMKLFSEDVPDEIDEDLPSVSMLGKAETPIKIVEKSETKHSASKKNSAGKRASSSADKKSRRTKNESNNATENVESALNTTFEMETDEQVNVAAPAVKLSGKKSLAKNRISIIDLTYSPVVQKGASGLDATFNPLANIAEEDEDGVAPLNRTFTEDDPKDRTFSPNPVQSAKKASPKSAKKTTPKSVKKTSPTLKRLQTRTPVQKLTTRMRSTPISKTMSSAKKVKVLEAAKVEIKRAAIEQTSSTKKKPAKTVVNVVAEPMVFQFGAEDSSRGFNFKLTTNVTEELNKQAEKKTAKKVRGFDFSLVSKIPTSKDLEKRQMEKNKIKSGKFVDIFTIF